MVPWEGHRAEEQFGYATPECDSALWETKEIPVDFRGLRSHDQWEKDRRKDAQKMLRRWSEDPEDVREKINRKKRILRKIARAGIFPRTSFALFRHIF